MSGEATSTRAMRFGAFEFDPRVGELRKQGMKLKGGGAATAMEGQNDAPVIAANVARSNAPTSHTGLVISRVAPNEPAIPKTRPTKIDCMPCFVTSSEILL